MDVTNRVLIVSGALLWIFLIAVIILLAWGSPEESIERLQDLANYVRDHNTDEAKLVLTLGGLLLALLGALVILIELAPERSGSLILQRVGGGEARIGTDEVKERLEVELRGLPQVSDVEASVVGRGKKAEVGLELHVGANADLAATSEEVLRLTREIIESRMGIALDCAPKVQLHYRELRVAEAPKSSPSPPSSGVPSAGPWPAPGGTVPTMRPAQPSAGSGQVPSPYVPRGVESADDIAQRAKEDHPAGG